MNFATATQVLAALDAELRLGAQSAVDLAALEQFDSAALAVLLELRRRFGTGAGVAVRAGAAQSFVVLNPPEKLRLLAQLYGVESLLFGAMDPV